MSYLPILGLGAVALIALASSKSAPKKAPDTQETAGGGNGGGGGGNGTPPPPGPGQNAGGTVPELDNPTVDTILGGDPYTQEQIFATLGYSDLPFYETQIERFQAHYNMISRQGGQTIEVVGENVKIPSDMGGLEVTGKLDKPTVAAALEALRLMGGNEYIRDELNPFILWSKNQLPAGVNEDEAALLMETPWLDLVRVVAESFAQYLTVEWIDAGAQPEYDFGAG